MHRHLSITAWTMRCTASRISKYGMNDKSCLSSISCQEQISHPTYMTYHTTRTNHWMFYSCSWICCSLKKCANSLHSAFRSASKHQNSSKTGISTALKTRCDVRHIWNVPKTTPCNKFSIAESIIHLLQQRRTQRALSVNIIINYLLFFHCMGPWFD